MSDDKTSEDTITINFSDDTLSGIDPFDISNTNMSYNYTSSWNTPITIGAIGSSNTVSLSGGSNGIGGLSGSWSASAMGIGGTTHSAIHVAEGQDITIGKRSLSTFMDKVEQRLSILQPDPELLEKYEALKLAYEHYKTLEALCVGDPPKDPNGK